MKSRLPVIFIVATVTLDAMGLGLILPVIPELILELEGGTLSSAAIWGGLLSFGYAVMQFLFGPTVGNLSDRYGRRPVLLIALLAMGTSYLAMALAPAIWMLLAARLISGVTGATFSTANAFMADISPPEKRAAHFGLVGAGFGMGFIFGPAIGGFLGEFGPRAPFYAAAALAFANALFGLLVLPESLKASRRRPFRLAEGNPFSAFLRLRALPAVGGLVFVMVFYQVASNVYPVIWAFYTLERFGWSTGMVGLSLAAFGICMALVQGGLIRILIPRFGAWRTAVFGLVVNIAAFTGYGFLNSELVLFLLLPVSAVGIVVTPALQSILSAAVADDRQGQLQGVWASSDGAARIVCPLLMTWLFERFTGPDAVYYLPGAPFVAAAVLAALSLAVLLGRGGQRHSTIGSIGS